MANKLLELLLAQMNQNQLLPVPPPVAYGPALQSHVVSPQQAVNTGTVGGGLENQMSALMNNLAIQRTPEESMIYRNAPSDPGLLEELLFQEADRVRKMQKQEELLKYKLEQDALAQQQADRDFQLRERDTASLEKGRAAEATLKDVQAHSLREGDKERIARDKAAADKFNRVMADSRAFENKLIPADTPFYGTGLPSGQTNTTGKKWRVRSFEEVAAHREKLMFDYGIGMPGATPDADASAMPSPTSAHLPTIRPQRTSVAPQNTTIRPGVPKPRTPKIMTYIAGIESGELNKQSMRELVKMGKKPDDLTPEEWAQLRQYLERS